MSEVAMVESSEPAAATEAPEEEKKVEPAFESPPAAAQPAKEDEPDPRARLHALAAELARSRNRRLMVEFLRLRRVVR